jgi:uncharacterized membrane protein
MNMVHRQEQHMPAQHEATTFAEVTGETSVVINRPADEIYAYLADLTRHPEWVDNVSKVTKITDGPIGVGSVFITAEGAPPLPFWQKMNMMRHFIAGLMSGAKPDSEAEITALEPGRRIAWKAGLRKGDGWFNRAEWALILQPQAGGTLVTQTFRYQPQTATAQRMVGAGGAAGIAQACNVSLQRLKAKLES